MDGGGGLTLLLDGLNEMPHADAAAYRKMCYALARIRRELYCACSATAFSSVAEASTTAHRSQALRIRFQEFK